jgi:hypothetical protein
MLAFCEASYDSGGSADETAESTGPRSNRFSTQAASFENEKGKTTGSNARQPAGSDEQELKVLTPDDLTPTAWKLLRTLLKLRATNTAKAVTRERIVQEAGDVGNADSSNVRAVCKMLVDLGLIATKRNVGTWITQAGLDALRPHR